MKKLIFLVPVGLLFFSFAHAQGDHLWINQVQVAGDGGADDEFIEIFNPSPNSISINNWSIQYKSSTGNFPLTVKKNLPNLAIPAGGYFLFAGKDYNGSISADLKQSTVSLSGTSTGATVFLVSSTSFLTSGTDTAIVDKLGYGTGANNSPETASAATPGSEKVLIRSQDTDNNSLDFSISDPTPHNGGASLIVPTPPTPAPTPAPTPEPTPLPTPAPVPTPNSSPMAVMIPEYSSSVLISEFLPNPDGADSGNEWIELYNDSAQSVDLSGWILDDESIMGAIGSTAYTISSGRISAHGYFVVNLPDGSFTLANTGGDVVRIFWPNKQLLSQVAYTVTAKVDESYAWRGDSSYGWTNLSTKGTANEFSLNQTRGVISAAQMKIKLNEIFPNPPGNDSGSEWVELVNTSDQPVALNAWFLDDGDRMALIGSTAYKFQSPMLSPGGLTVVTIPAGKFAMNNSGTETVRLFNNQKVLMDWISYDGSQEGESYALVNGKWIWTTPTPNAENVVASVLPKIADDIVISELYPQPSKGEEEFVELFNAGDKAVDLSGFVLSDLSTKYKFEKIILAANEYLVIDKATSKIALNNSGKERVELLSADGAVVSAVEYEGAPGGESYNLLPDGSFAWSSVKTPGVANKIGKLTQVKEIAKKSTIKEASSGVVTQNALVTNSDPQVSGEQISFSNPLKTTGQTSSSFSKYIGISRVELTFWLIGSFALNLVFCYSLIKLTGGKGNV